MSWTNQLVACLLVALSCTTVMCDGGTLEEYLQVKESYRQEVDRLFYMFYPHDTSDQLSEDTDIKLKDDGVRNKPIPSPDWSIEDIYEDLGDVTSLEDGNYRPRMEGSGGGDLGTGTDDEDDFSGGSGTFPEERPPEVSDEDDDVTFPPRFPEERPGVHDEDDDVTFPQTFPGIPDTTTLPNNADNRSCDGYLKTEINSCIEMALDVSTILRQMEHHVSRSGYYNVTSTSYLAKLFRACASTIVGPPSCVAVNDIDKIIVEVVERFVVYVYSNEGVGGMNLDPISFDCFRTHLQLLQSCLRSGGVDGRLDGVVRMVLGGLKVAERECVDLREVQRCVRESMSKCEDDSTSPELVDVMFETTLGAVTSCLPPSVGGAGDLKVTFAGNVNTLALSILALFLHKQIRY